MSQQDLEPQQKWVSPERAEEWRRSQQARAGLYDAATERLLDLAGVGPGSRVLDVAAGAGEQTLLAARRVGPDGAVLATDVSASMVELTLQAAREAGLSNVEAGVMDAQHLDVQTGTFDAVICRFALMWFPNPSVALAEMHRAVRPGGRVAALVFAAADKNPVSAIPQQVLRRVGGLPEPAPDSPGMFALGEERLLRSLFERAGFDPVVVEAVQIWRRFPSIAEAMHYIKSNNVCVTELLPSLSEAQRVVAWEEIERALQPYTGAEGFAGPAELLIAVGTRRP